MPVVIKVEARRSVGRLAAEIVAFKQRVAGRAAEGYRRVGELILADMGRQFDADSPGGGAWKALAPATVARKGHGKILVETGDMRRSLNPGDVNNVLLPRPDGVTVGTNHPLAPYHQFGTRTAPRRRFVRPPSPAAKAAIDAAVARVVRENTFGLFGRR